MQGAGSRNGISRLRMPGSNGPEIICPVVRDWSFFGMTPRIIILAAVSAALGWAPLPLRAQDASPPARPRITGLSHVALWVTDLEKSRSYYKGYLGFDEPFTLNNKAGGVLLTWIKVNDRQSIELFPISDSTPRNGDSLYHIALETDDAQGMLAYLISKGVTAPGGKPLPSKAKAGQIGNLNYFTEDPDGHIVEFTQYMPNGWTLQKAGQFMPPTRIAMRMSHAGIVAADLEASLHFYRDILGFREFWRGSSDGKTLSWVNLRTPEGLDYIELMLYGAKPSLAQLHVLNHLCLEVRDAAAAGDTLKSRPLPDGCPAPTPIRIGKNGKRQVNSYDPDGTRVEMMEANTVDGTPAAPSHALPPASHPPGY
jgi:catechol 2,3-dioxygenase-like lactoylglutathione lyase family enzyme